jgi:hypothetical protein
MAPPRGFTFSDGSPSFFTQYTAYQQQTTTTAAALAPAAPTTTKTTTKTITKTITTKTIRALETVYQTDNQTRMRHWQ